MNLLLFALAVTIAIKPRSVESKGFRRASRYTIRAVDTVYDGHLCAHRWRDGMCRVCNQGRDRYVPEVAQWIHYSFWRPIGNKGKLLYTCVYCMAAVLCHGGELLLVHLCGEASFTAPPRRRHVDRSYNGSTHCSSRILDDGVRLSFPILNARNV